jgi:hypothetical protein
MQQKLLLILFLVIGTAGCITQHQPSLTNPMMAPKDLKPGDTALITVTVEDKFALVNTVTGIVEEDKTITFNFRDDGMEGDIVAGDNIWSMKVDVPFNAPPGKFNYKISAYDLNGNLIIVRDENNEATGMSTSFLLEITYPEEVGSLE